MLILRVMRMRKPGFDHTDVGKCNGEFRLKTFTSLIFQIAVYYQWNVIMRIRWRPY
jgi:hypothetical protein